MPDLTPLNEILLPNTIPLLIGLIAGGTLGWLLSQDERATWALTPFLWILLIVTSALIPTGDWELEQGWLFAAFAQPPLWLPVMLMVAVSWRAAKPRHALRMGFGLAWLLLFGHAIAGESVLNAADPLMIEPAWAGWVIYGVVGLVIDRLLALGGRYLGDVIPVEEGAQVGWRRRWAWGAGGVAAGMVILEIIGQTGNGPTVSGALGAVLQGLGASNALGEELMHLTRPIEWFGTLGWLVVGLAITIPVSLVATSWITKPSTRLAVSSAAAFVLYGGVLTIALPASSYPVPGPTFSARLLSFLVPLFLWSLLMISAGVEGRLQSLYLLGWVLATGWLPLLGTMTTGDRLYIIAAFRNGQGLALVVLGQAIVATVIGAILLEVWRVRYGEARGRRRRGGR